MSRKEMISLEVDRWASRHPDRDNAVLVFGSASYSPRQIAREIGLGTQAGRDLIDLFEEAADCYSIEELLDSLAQEFVTIGSPSDPP
jgi:hypothetical protein